MSNLCQNIRYSKKLLSISGAYISTAFILLKIYLKLGQNYVKKCEK